MKRVVVLVLLVALGAAGGVLGYRRLEARARDGAAGALVLHGNVELRDAQLAFPGPERVAEVLVEEGDRVAPGQLLARQRTERVDAELAAAEARVRAQQALVDELEHGARAEELAQARAARDAAQVRVDNAERVIERMRATVESGATSAQELDDARAALAVARAELEVRAQELALAQAGPRAEERARAAATLDALRGELAVLRRRRADAELRAPSAGVVRSRILEPGEASSAERPVLTLALTEAKWVRAFVPEPQLGRVAGGMRAVVRSDSFGGREYEGRVGFVSPMAEFTPKAVETSELRTQLVYEVRVNVPDPDDELRLGMPVTVELDVEGGADRAPAAGDAPRSEGGR